MNDRVFVDTNLLVYAYSATEPEKKEIVLTLLEKHVVIVSTQVINEFIWIMNRKFQVEMESLKLITDRFWRRFKVSLVKKETVKRAIDITIHYKFAYWDSLIIASAFHSDCLFLYSEDLQDGQAIEKKLQIVNPFLHK